MAANLHVPPANAFLNVLHAASNGIVVADTVADNAVSDFLAEIVRLDQRYNKNKQIPQDQLAELVFGRSRAFQDERSFIPYCRYHLRAAVEQLGKLVDEIRPLNKGVFTAAELVRLHDTLVDYVFDLKDIIPFLQRKVPGYVYLLGAKNSAVTSWEVYLLSNALAYQSSHIGGASPFPHKVAQIASMFVLRQAMELRFDRLIGVYPIDRKGKSPRLNHGFHQDFIVANPQFFRANGFDIKKMRYLYDWCSEIVHQAYQPYAWQIALALEIGSKLLHTRAAAPGQAWSIFNAVEVLDVEKMQSAYEKHFLTTYGHGKWRMTRIKPEALVRGWRPEMGKTDENYQSVVNKLNPCTRIGNSLRRLICRRS